MEKSDENKKIEISCLGKGKQKSGMSYSAFRFPKKLLEDCDCGLKPKHKLFEHDNCCQICGGSHVERICPSKK